MSSRALTTWARSITAKFLAIHLLFFILSALFFYLSVFFAFNQILLNKESEIIRELLRQITAASSTSSFDEVIEAANAEITAFGSNNILIRIISPQEDAWLPTDEDWDAYRTALPDDPEPMLQRVESIQGDTEDLLRLITGRSANGYYVQVGYRSNARQEFVTQLQRTSLTAFVPTLLVGLLCSLLLSRQTLRGIARVRQAAMDICQQGNLDRRVERTHNRDEIDHLAEAFNLMLSRIETLLRNMRGMLDNVAHDLRTPLTRLRGSAELALAHDRPPEEYRAILARSLAEHDALIAMVNAILNLSQAESGAMILNRTEIDAADLLESMHDFFQPLAQENGVAFSVSCPAGLRLTADEQRLRMVILNLLDNAFKYTEAGGRIRLSAERADGRVLLRVQDSGTGVDPDDLEHIFKRFHRSKDARRHGGYGLGLSLVKAIVELHGGSVTVASAPGQGASFTVNLPG